MRRWIILLLLGLGLAGSILPSLAAPTWQVTPYPVEYTFGGQVTLRANIASDAPISSVQVFLRSRGDTETYTGSAFFNNNEIIYQHDLTTEPLRAFSHIEYWFQITPKSGDPYQSDTFSFLYEDNRFDWQTLSSGSVFVHWYEGDTAFGQSVLNAAEAGLDRASSLVVLPTLQPVNIYVYASGVEMQSTLRLGALRWIAGHADPDLGVAVVSLPTGPYQRSEIERQIPHEVMHLLLYQVVGSPYYQLPIWLKEGLASANEMRPNPDYYVILSQAVEQNILIPMTSLCQTFPQDNNVYLAYAQSDSFVRYLYQQYGQTGIQGLVNNYASGEGCETAPQSVMGLSLSELEQDWRRAALNDNVLGAALEALLPWGTLLLVVFFVPLLLVLTSLRKSPHPRPSQA
jgi:hypothetical protein